MFTTLRDLQLNEKCGYREMWWEEKSVQQGKKCGKIPPLESDGRWIRVGSQKGEKFIVWKSLKGREKLQIFTSK